MNKLLIIAAFVLCMVSCANNDADIAPTDDLVQMQFKVGALDVNNEPMNAKRAPGATRAAGDEFGTIKLWIAPGT